MKFSLSLIAISLLIFSCGSHKSETTAIQQDYNQPHRPQIHFSPKAKWMNDPNGLVYFNGVYHLFFQFYPDSTVWGPMHWGHATSKDLIHWEQQPIALYPDSLGYIFSGSAVVDSNNTSGFGKDGKIPLVAIFTQHDPKGEKAGSLTYQNQSIAYSLDEGQTWTKYAGNPVLKNPGIKDFRDPNVSWYEEEKKWIMALATFDRITFYSSKDLKTWNKESEFGKNAGAHGSVWECPDLFPLFYNGEMIWVLLVSLGPGGPNNGSATQYFTGTFDGTTFKPFQIDTRWIDYGTDDYAGVTWSNTGNRKIFIGWMNDWLYADDVPTKEWRGATTIPRELQLHKIHGKYYVSSEPVKELNQIKTDTVLLPTFSATDYSVSVKPGPFEISFSSDSIKTYNIILSNDLGQRVNLGFDKLTNKYFILRSLSGNVSFHPAFPGTHFAPRIDTTVNTNITLLVDKASIEFFPDNGLTVMTDICFPDQPWTKVSIMSNGIVLKDFRYMPLKSIWKN